MDKKKWIGLIAFSFVVGGLVGILEVIFGKVLLVFTDWRGAYLGYFILFLPIAGLFIEWLYTRFGGKSRQGMSLIFDAGHGETDDVPLRLIPIVIVSTWLTHLFGGSAGREGVAVQIGGALSHWMSQRKWQVFLPKKNMPQIALITGMAAGFSGLFQTPMAAILFALEVLVVGKFEIRALFSASIASFTAYFVSSSLGLEKFSFLIESQLAFTPKLVMKLVLLGLIFGLVGRFFAVSLAKGKSFAKDLIPNNYKRIFIGGAMIAVLIFVIHHGRYAGLGSNLISASLTGETIYFYDFFLKIAFTVLTLSVGFQGGEVTPLFAIGSALGAVLAPMIGLPVEMVAAIGYMAVFGSATNTFLAPILIGGEVFGYDLLPVFFVAMCIAYSCNGNQSIYGKQQMLN